MLLKHLSFLELCTCGAIFVCLCDTCGKLFLGMHHHRVKFYNRGNNCNLAQVHVCAVVKPNAKAHLAHKASGLAADGGTRGGLLRCVEGQ